jgi:ABC-type glutathione transport system ATPase component
MTEALMEVRGLAVAYRDRARSGVRVALADIDLSVRRGEALGLVGESGAGKSTLARCMAGIQAPTRGFISFRGAPLRTEKDRDQRRRIQMVFQDPFASLNPRMTVRSVLREVLLLNDVVDRARVDHRCEELMARVGLPASTLNCRPRVLSGGQRQRVGIARALALEPDLLIADEPVSALDVSVQAAVLALLYDLQQSLGLTVVLVTHDLGVVRQFCDRAAVMRAGLIVERGYVEMLFKKPGHAYTRELLAAVPRLPAFDDRFASPPTERIGGGLAAASARAPHDDCAKSRSVPETGWPE